MKQVLVEIKIFAFEDKKRLAKNEQWFIGGDGEPDDIFFDHIKEIITKTRMGENADLPILV